MTSAILAAFPNVELKEECKWGKPTCTVAGRNGVIMHGFELSRTGWLPASRRRTMSSSA